MMIQIGGHFNPCTVESKSDDSNRSVENLKRSWGLGGGSPPMMFEEVMIKVGVQ